MKLRSVAILVVLAVATALVYLLVREHAKQPNHREGVILHAPAH